MDYVFYSFSKTCELLGKTEEELKKLVSEGEIRAFRHGNGMKFRRDDLERLLDKKLDDVPSDIDGDALDSLSDSDTRAPTITLGTPFAAISSPDDTDAKPAQDPHAAPTPDPDGDASKNGEQAATAQPATTSVAPASDGSGYIIGGLVFVIGVAVGAVLVLALQ